MMVIWACDRCGKQVERSGIVTHTHDYMKAGFQELSVPVGNIHDLCKPCFANVEKAVVEAQSTGAQRFKDAIATAVSGSPVTAANSPNFWERITGRKS